MPESPGIFSAEVSNTSASWARAARTEAVGHLGALEAAVRLHSLEQEDLARLLVEAAGDVGAFGQEQGAHLALHESEPDGFQVR